MPATVAGAAERAVPWELVGPLPDAQAESVRIRFGVDVCGTNQDAQRVDVARSPGTATVTAFDEEPEGAEVCPSVLRFVERKVDLGGSLRGRSITDGSTSNEVVPAETPVAGWTLDGPGRQGLRQVPIDVPIGCEGSVISRAPMVRRKRSVTITATLRVMAPCTPTTVTSYFSVGLRGRLGRRALRDGAYSPPRAVYRAKPRF